MLVLLKNRVSKYNRYKKSIEKVKYIKIRVIVKYKNNMNNYHKILGKK